MTGMSRPIGSSENGCTGSCLELVIGTPERFHCGKQIASYVGWFLRRNSAAIADVSDISTSKGTPCCAICWWKRTSRFGRDQKRPSPAQPSTLCWARSFTK